MLLIELIAKKGDILELNYTDYINLKKDYFLNTVTDYDYIYLLNNIIEYKIDILINNKDIQKDKILLKKIKVNKVYLTDKIDIIIDGIFDFNYVKFKDINILYNLIKDFKGLIKEVYFKNYINEKEMEIFFNLVDYIYKAI